MTEEKQPNATNTHPMVAFSVSFDPGILGGPIRTYQGPALTLAPASNSDLELTAWFKKALSEATSNASFTLKGVYDFRDQLAWFDSLFAPYGFERVHYLPGNTGPRPLSVAGYQFNRNLRATHAAAAALTPAPAPAPELNTGRKDDAGKARYDLIPPDILAASARVLAFGAAKYGDENWRKLPKRKPRFYAAAMRHIEAWRSGQELDPESGEPHLAHAITCLMVLSQGDDDA